MKILESHGGVALLAGFVCYLAAFGLLIFAPLVLTDASIPRVTNVVTGESQPVPDYTERQFAGRQVYIREMCWHCHSQFVRPVNEEHLRYGPVSQAGESAIDRPHMFGTRRTGPDLAREGWLRVPDWQIAHLFNPRHTVSESVMPAFTWYFRDNPVRERVAAAIARLDSDGDGIVSEFDDKSAWTAEDHDLLRSASLDNAGVLAPAGGFAQSEGGAEIRGGTYVNAYTEEDRGDGILSDYDGRSLPTKEAVDLVEYLQRLGTTVGPWRQQLGGSTPDRGPTPPMRGVDVEWRTPEGEVVTLSVPDGRMPRRAREARLYGLARERADEGRRREADDLSAQYAALMAAWRARNPEWAQRLDRGEQLYARHCAACHGDEGRGNGPGAQHLLIRPRDFTIAAYRYRSVQTKFPPLDGDLYRSLDRGLWGSSMPSWRRLGSEALWLLVDYVKSFQETRGGEAEEFNQIEQRLAIPPQPAIRAENLERHLARGRAVYMAMKCMNCHGSEGRGDGPGWNATRKDEGQLIRPRDFPPRHVVNGVDTTMTPEGHPNGEVPDIPALRYRGGASAEDIYRAIFTGLTGANMPSSLPDFQTAWEAEAALARLEAQGVTGPELEAAQVAARRRFFAVLGEDLPGVVRETDAGGNVVAEYVDRIRPSPLTPVRGARPGDDWALVHYVMSLSGIPIPTMR